MTWFFIALAFIPAFFCPTVTFNGFSVPQTLALGTLSALGLLLGVWGGALPTSPSSILSILFSAYMVASLLWMYPPHNARKELGQQLPMQLVFLLGCVYLDWESVRLVVVAFSGMLLLQVVYSYAQTRLIDPFFPPKIKGGGKANNPIGSIGNPNFLAAYFSTTIWLGVYAAVSFSPWLWIVPALTLFMLKKTGCRAGQIAAAGSTAFFILIAAFYDKLPFWNDSVWALGMSGIVMFALFLVISLITFWDTFWNKPIDPKGPQIWYASLRYRLCFWITALYLVREKPLFGWGMWSFRKEVYRMQAWLHHNKWDTFLKHDRYLTPQPREVHNDFIEYVVEFGVVGAALVFTLIGSVYYVGFKFLGATPSQGEFFLMLILLTSMTSALLDAIFFFLLRLPSSAVVFWVTCAMVVGVAGKETIALGQSLPLAIAVVACLWVPFMYYCMITRFMASYHFSASRSTNNDLKRGHHMDRALRWQPHDTLLRTYAALSILDFDQTGATIHGMKVLDDFDGMAPQHSTFFNLGLIKARTRNIFEEACIYLNYSHWLNPFYPPTKDLLFSRDGVGVRSPYIGGERALIKANEETLWKIKALMRARENINLKLREVEYVKEDFVKRCSPDVPPLERENQTLKMGLLIKEQELLMRDIQAAYLSLKSVIVMEKKRLNVPDNWFYNKALGEFLAPTEVDAVKAEDVLLPDCTDAAPMVMESGTSLMTKFMRGKEAYSALGRKDGEAGSILGTDDGRADALQAA